MRKDWIVRVNTDSNGPPEWLSALLDLWPKAPGKNTFE